MKKVLLVLVVLCLFSVVNAQAIPSKQTLKKQANVIVKKLIHRGERISASFDVPLKELRFMVQFNRLQLFTGVKVFLGYVSFVILGMFFNYFFLTNFIFIGEYVKAKTFASFMYGLGILPLSLLLFLVTMGTWLGFLFLPALFFVYVFYLFFSIYTTATLIGEQFVKVFTFKDHPYFEQFLGISFLFVVLLIPYVGWILAALLLLIGMGAVARLKFGVRGS